MGECGFCTLVAKDRDQWLGSCEHSTEPHHFCSELYYDLTIKLSPCSKVLSGELIDAYLRNALPDFGGKS
jgi:hypothetical protein